MPRRARTRNSKLETRNSPALVSPLLRWFARHARDLPWRRTRDPYAVWISEIMLQQTQVRTVIPYWERWIRALPDLRSLADASPGRVLKLWEGLGYYTRARNLQRAAQRIVASHDGRFPRRFEDLLALPGIGRYTAGAISSIAFHEPRPILDGNVIRVLTRLFGIADDPRARKTNDRLWQIAEELVTHAGPRRCSALNQSLMELGALLCTPRAPRCEACPLSARCVAFRSGRTAALPNLPPRAAATARRSIAFVIERHGTFLVRQRPAGEVNAHLWEFPNVDTTLASHVAPGEVLRKHFLIRPRSLTSLGEVRHSITRYRIVLEAFHVIPRPSAAVRLARGTWQPLSQLDALALTSAHRKVLEALGRVRRPAPTGARSSVCV